MKNKKFHGRGISITSRGYIHIRYFNNGFYAPGNYMNIFSDGEVDVGEYYKIDGEGHYK